MPIHIEPEHPDDAAAIRAVNDAAFGQPEEGALVDALRRGPTFVPGLSLVARAAGSVVGHILFSEVVIEGPGAGPRALALAPMAVLPAFQRQGVGSQLVTRGLEACKQAGYPAVIVLGHARFYPRFGFRPASAFGIRGPWPVPDEVFMALELSPSALAGPGGTVRYPPPFDSV